eukprot:jgi/Ulvmu1/6379/UM003_0007.1
MQFNQSYLCAVCRKPASVWCQQDAASLCYSCDERVHTASSLARTHTRIALPDHGQMAKLAAPSPSYASECRPDSALEFLSRAHEENAVSGDVDGLKRYSNLAQINQVPDVVEPDESYHMNVLAGPSFDSFELFQTSFEEATASYGNGDPGLAKPVYPGGLEIEQDWGSSWPGSCVGAPPECTEVPMTNADTPPSPAHQADAGAAATPPAPEQDVQSSQATGDQFLQPTPFSPHQGFSYPSLAAPDAACSATAMPPSLQAPWGQHPMLAMPAMSMLPSGMVLVQQMAPWMSYIPASLRPPPPEDEETTAQRSAARSSRLTRFQRKKQRLSCRKAVRYESRKRYADSRPRVNGRFISNAESAAAAAAPAV